MKKVISRLTRKEISIAAIVAFLAIVYFLFLKPGPLVRIDLNKVSASKKNSSLTIDAPSEISGVGKQFTVKINLDTQGHYVNAVQSYLEFDPKVLEVVKSNTEESFCKYYPENNFNNDKGLIVLSCGSPYPGFKGKNNVQSIEFLAKAIKTTQLSLTNQSMVLANDGKGTNLLNDFDTSTVKIKAGL